ncbi:hypothetical protein [Cloacibacillus evryensis]|uniref:hypothetical protein n=1 Tax=Cloacibacillus evryensis TaxID=508460 RepID=UPI00210C979B|nr:hypothetical protein [Cloacibacillus evryensis]
MKIFTDEDRRELKDKLKTAIFRRLEPTTQRDLCIIDSKDLPDLIKVLLQISD